MKLLGKLWFRIVLSLVLGGMGNELIYITTGDPNRPQAFNFSLYIALGLFLLFTIIVFIDKNRLREE